MMCLRHSMRERWDIFAASGKRKNIFKKGLAF
jgi:hypothetical protein